MTTADLLAMVAESFTVDLAATLRARAQRIREAIAKRPPIARDRQFEHDMWRGGKAMAEALNAPDEESAPDDLTRSANHRFATLTGKARDR
jgi:hypothetical protein